MKKSFYKFISHLIIPLFLIYWIGNTSLGLSFISSRNRLGEAFPTFNKLFGRSWNLFVKSIDFNDRMYLVLRDKTTKQQTDSLELLEELAIEKQQHAPFNQSEFIIDRLVNHYVNFIEHQRVKYLTLITKYNRNIEVTELKKRLDSFEKNDPSFQAGQQTLFNYCKIALARKNIDTTNKEFKIVILEKKIQRFEDRKNPPATDNGLLYLETLDPKDSDTKMSDVIFFESSYKSFTQ